jgi:hypothetical protein
MKRVGKREERHRVRMCKTILPKGGGGGGKGRVLTWIFFMPVRGPLFPPQNPSVTQSGTTSSLWGHIPPVVKQCLSDWNILKRPFLTPQDSRQKQCQTLRQDQKMSGTIVRYTASAPLPPPRCCNPSPPHRWLTSTAHLGHVVILPAFLQCLSLCQTSAWYWLGTHIVSTTPAGLSSVRSQHLASDNPIIPALPQALCRSLPTRVSPAQPCMPPTCCCSLSPDGRNTYCSRPQHDSRPVMATAVWISQPPPRANQPRSEHYPHAPPPIQQEGEIPHSGAACRDFPARAA